MKVKIVSGIVTLTLLCVVGYFVVAWVPTDPVKEDARKMLEYALVISGVAFTFYWIWDLRSIRRLGPPKKTIILKII